MGSINGTGISYWGWRHSPDGTATATQWLTIFWMPVIPLYRQRVRVLTDLATGEPGLHAGFAMVDVTEYQDLGRLPLSGAEVVVTLLKAYLGLPLILVGPLPIVVPLFALVAKSLELLGVDARAAAPAVGLVIMVPVALIVVNFIWQCLLAIRAGRGWHPDALLRADPVRRRLKLVFPKLFKEQRRANPRRRRRRPRFRADGAAET